jgi:TRAP-type C4-dicarboxylate transport system permease small subunit
MSRLVAMVDGLSELCGRIAGWGLVLIGFIVSYEVFMRYVFVAPTSWVSEISQNIQIWAVFLGAAFALKHRQMVTIDVAFSEPGTVRRKLAESLGLIMLFVMTVLAVWFGFQIWLRATRAGHTTGSVLGMPRWLTDSAVWVGLGLLTVQGLAEFWRVWAVRASPEKREPLDQGR